jgi:aryl-alcohol dehydrogenase-like predicted oxidoreductase
MGNLVLGTVQFGLNYGISNKTGQVSYDQACKILDLAYENGIQSLDTANAYGDSEKVIGRYLCSSRRFSIITKIKEIQSGLSDKQVQQVFYESYSNSLDNLMQDQVDTMLLHDSKNLKEYPFLLDLLIELKDKKICKKIGVSGYDISVDRDILNYLDAVQYPGNLFDHQLCNINLSVDIYIRSIFLQGLFFLSLDEIKTKMIEAYPYISILKKICAEYDLSIEELAVGFCKNITKNANILVGVLSTEEFKRNIEVFNKTNLSEEICNKILSEFSQIPEKVKNPSLWKKK